MENTTQYELRLAQRMSRLGTETAFEVLNKARALEKLGKKIVHLEIGEPDFDTPHNVVEAGIERLAQRLDSLRTVRRPARVAPGYRRGCQPLARGEGYERRSRGCSRRQAYYFLHSAGFS